MEETLTVSARPATTDPVIPGAGTFLPRAIFYVILLLFASAALWASVADVDVVIQTRGRLVVEGEPVRITPAEQGLVTDVRVKAGDRVAKGDVLLRLDPLRHSAEAAALEAEINVLRAEAAHARQTAAERAGVLRSMNDERKLTERAAGILDGQIRTWKELLARGVASASQVEEKERESIDLQARRARLETDIRRGESEAAQSERRAVECEGKIVGLEAQRARLLESQIRMTLIAPCDGTVTQVSVAHPGRVIGTTEPAVVINPDGLPLRAELRVPNVSMRRLQPGMRVRMRLDAYPYQDFGCTEGALSSLNPDADADGFYRAWATLDTPEIRGPRGTEKVRAGLQLDADVVAERRTVMDLVMRPFRRLGDPVRMAE